jgi:hypothetical protein
MGATTSQFGTSSRNPYRSFGAAPLDSDDDEPRVVGTFRTVCVRLSRRLLLPR